MQASIRWSFAEQCHRAASVEAVKQLFMREVRALGFSFAACASHVDPLRPPAGAVVMVDYPQTWLERFSAMNYARRDPVFLAARKRLLPFQWRDPAFRSTLAPDQIEILNEAAEAGLADGVTIPINAPDALAASCSLAIGPDGVDPLHVRDALWFAFYAYECARRLLLQRPEPRRVSLSPREREIFTLIARGKTDFEVSVILSLSEHTVRNRVKMVLAKYGVTTRTQVVARALRSGELRLEGLSG